ncbi:MAG: serine/threonine protein kinase [Muribaculaceae bacterium]|nr:serine/threonine protein kinase [Muribaculaceae bacterium]
MAIPNQQKPDRGKPKPQVFVRPNDPFIYLRVRTDWYCYCPTDTPLGQGAMGTVYVGYNCKTRERIAVKRVIDRYANVPQVRERARQEAALEFRHPNLVEMIGYCEYAHDSGPIFLLSNLVEGQNLDAFVNGMSLEDPHRVEKICTAIYQILDALDYIHSRGVIHRDIKPSNIMVEGNGNVRLMDLGIARMAEGNAFSQYGFIGTPEYSAPEQINRDRTGVTNPIDARTDIYALGITFYEMLTGSNPMSANSDAMILSNQMTRILPDASNIPRRLMNVILKATEKEASKRFSRAIDFKNAIIDAMTPRPSLWERVINMLSF